MAKPEKLREPRAFSFRMPGEAFDVLSTVAKARGVDVSAVLNWVLSGALPHLLQEKAEHEEAMRQAASARVWAKQPSTSKAIEVLRGLLTELQEEYAKLVKQALDEGGRRAA